MVIKCGVIFSPPNTSIVQSISLLMVIQELGVIIIPSMIIKEDSIIYAHKRMNIVIKIQEEMYNYL